MPTAKFDIGSKVHLKNGTEYDTGEVLSITLTKDNVLYKITSKELDFQKKEVINGIIHAYEDELELVT